MTEIRFSCVQCGRCCQNTALPLTFDEAITWLEDGGEVSVYCEADPWPFEPPADNVRAAHRKRRSFPVVCGSSTARVTAILTAPMDGACRNLGDGLLCRIYEKRPLVCRIYPAEISPFIQLNTATKHCPPEAWQAGDVIIEDSRLVNHALRLLVETSRQTDQDDAQEKGLLCGALKINVTALAGEGFIAYKPEPRKLLKTMRRIRLGDTGVEPVPNDWRLYSPLSDKVQPLRSQGFQLIQAITAVDRFSFVWSPLAHRD